MRSIRPDGLAADVERLLDTFEQVSARYREGGAGGLVRKIRPQWQSGSLKDETVDHLAKWRDPDRSAEREQTIQPLAQELSIALFGEVVLRRPGV